MIAFDYVNNMDLVTVFLHYLMIYNRSLADGREIARAAQSGRVTGRLPPA